MLNFIIFYLVKIHEFKKMVVMLPINEVKKYYIKQNKS